MISKFQLVLIITSVITFFSSLFLIFFISLNDLSLSNAQQILLVLLFLLSGLYSSKINRLLKEKSVYIIYFWILIITSTMFYLGDYFFDIFLNLEEDSISWRFKLTREKVGKTTISLEEGFIERYDPPEGARAEIQIFGIKTETIEKLNGKWPLQWDIYANVINKFSESNNILFFDIFFLDEKERESDVLSDALQKNKNVIIDYPIESNTGTRASIEDYDEKISELNKYKLINIIDPNDSGIVWLDYPIPPILQVSKFVGGMGFANIKRDDDLPNRKMPLVAKIPFKGSYIYYPSVDLVVVCKYLGIDVVNDTEIILGKHIILKNIPEKKIVTGVSPGIDKEYNTGNITIPIDRYGQMEINFVGSIYSFKDDDIYDVAYEWNQDVINSFENKIFLVAMYHATGLNTAKDLHLSPYGDIAGIEHHAHAINTILNRNFIKTLDKKINLLILLFIGLVITLLQISLRSSLSISLSLILLLSYTVISVYLFSEFSIIIELVPIIFNNFTIIIFTNVYKILNEEKKSLQIRSTFSKFVSREIVDELLRNPDEVSLGGSRKEITVFFSDIRGFTAISETISPEELVTIINEYFNLMSRVILEYKGTIDKYIGDAIMAFWGAPLTLEDHAYYACLTALEQKRKLLILQKSWEKRQLPHIDIGIGLNSGYAVVGNMGSSYRMEYTCMGDTVNLASRLEGLNKSYGTSIIISENTYEKVKEKVYARELDRIRVKGKMESVTIYELLGLKDDSNFNKLKNDVI